MYRDTQDLIYKKLSVHEKFDLLSKRHQDVITYLAAGYTQKELKKVFKVSKTRIFQLRNQVIFRLGYRVFENGHSRPMTMKELNQKIIN